jgi:hypothetical protein
MSDHPHDFSLTLERFEARLPQRLADWSRYLRRPESRNVRIPAAILLVLGGLLSFLPVLGIWMLPLGLLLVAVDLPRLQPPLVRVLHYVERRWLTRGEPRG